MKAPVRLGTLFNTGETAAFEDAVADSLIAQGFAVAGKAKVDAPPRPQTVTPAPLPVPRVAEVSPRTVDLTTASVATTPSAEATEADARADTGALQPAPGTSDGKPADSTSDKKAGDKPEFIPTKPGKAG